MISYLSEYFELAAGDVILSGTPVGRRSRGEGRRDGDRSRRAGQHDRYGNLINCAKCSLPPRR